jgi:hypothetical protein
LYKHEGGGWNSKYEKQRPKMRLEEEERWRRRRAGGERDGYFLIKVEA